MFLEQYRTRRICGLHDAFVRGYLERDLIIELNLLRQKPKFIEYDSFGP